MNSPAAFYGRVSTDHQENSLEAQLAATRAYAASRGLDIPDGLVFRDSDTSGSIPFAQRPGGQLLLNTLRLLNDGQGTQVKNLIITKIDRLGRTLLDLETQVQAFKKAGLILHITDFGGDSMSTAGLAGELVLRVLFAVAEFERGMIRERAQTGINHLRAQGRCLGTVPFGWDAYEQGLPAAGKKNPPRFLKVNPEEMRWVIQASAWRASGWSYHRIALELNRAGVRSKTPQGREVKCRQQVVARTSGRWQSGNVEGMLTNRTNAEYLAGLAASSLDQDLAA